MRAKYAVWTAAVACSAVIPDTSTEPIETPPAITGGGGGGASARAWLAPTPTAQTTRQRMKPARLATDRWILAFGPYASVDQGAVGNSRSWRLSPRAAYSRIIRSVTHST